MISYLGPSVLICPQTGEKILLLALRKAATERTIILKTTCSQGFFNKKGKFGIKGITST